MANSSMRRALVPVGIVAALALAACSSGGGTPPDTSAPTGGGSTATSGAPAPTGPITVWVAGDATTNFDQLVAPFTQATGVQVKTVAIPWDSFDQKFTTAVASGDGPDVVQVGLSKLRTYADTGALLTLDDATLAGCDAVHDRAALIALPREMRDRYVHELHARLPAGCRGLLVTLEYPPHEKAGPPFPVDAGEVRRLYDRDWTLECLERRDILAEQPGLAAEGVTSLHTAAWRLEKRA